MTFSEFTITALMSLSNLLGVHDTPAPNPGWNITQNWKQENGINYFEAESSEIIKTCQAHPEGYIEFPGIIHSAHVVTVDSMPILNFGDPTFQTMRSFYGSPNIRCSQVAKAGSKLNWKVFCYSKYFSRLTSFPKFSESKPDYNILAETTNILAAGGLYLLAFFSFLVFWRKTSNDLVLSVVLSSLFFSNYFFGAVAGLLEMEIPMIYSHKFSDANVYLGFVSMINAMRIQGLVGSKIFKFYAALAAVAIAIIITGPTADAVQFGTSLPFGLTVGILAAAMVKPIRKLATKKEDSLPILQILSLASFTVFASNDIFIVTGITGGAPLLPLGVVGGQLFLALAVNNRITDTYKERDYLRGNLEAEVKRKTASLEKAMMDLKVTQAELIQSAKLASLGTLSAGIAHEINNSLNYVNGSMLPLERILNKLTSEPDKKIEKEKADKLLGIMKQGLHLTLEIIKSFKNYTGLNQANFNDVHVGEVVTSVLTIMKGKFREKVTIKCEIDPELSVFGSVVGLHQVFMNLISNSIDAMETGGNLTISSKKIGDEIEVLINDTGSGMAPDVIQRVFEPFFTTKSVGKGTGLGLHIVKNEIDKHKGKIKITSRVGIGTQICLTLPIHGRNIEEKAA